MFDLLYNPLVVVSFASLEVFQRKNGKGGPQNAASIIDEYPREPELTDEGRLAIISNKELITRNPAESC
jgi:hypothetical protein